LAFTALDDAATTAAVAAEARERAVWLNAADDPAHCSFILPAVVRRGALTVAVASGGATPALTRALRDHLEASLGPEWATLAELAAEARRELRAAGRAADGGTWRRALASDVRALIVEDRLVRHARRGCFVVRLKCGDPFVFGRGGEEAEALAAAGVAFEIVPGVSSAVAVPAYAGIPVTHRGTASSFAVVTGHEDDGKTGSAVDWTRLATAVDTLVILMGARSLPRIAAALLQGGRAPETPVALIRWGTTDAQETVIGRLDEIATRPDAVRLGPPVVVVIGDVVGLRERLASFAGVPDGEAEARPPQLRELALQR